MEAINFKSASVMDIQVLRRLLAATRTRANNNFRSCGEKVPPVSKGHNRGVSSPHSALGNAPNGQFASVPQIQPKRSQGTPSRFPRLAALTAERNLRSRPAEYFGRMQRSIANDLTVISVPAIRLASDWGMTWPS